MATKVNQPERAYIGWEVLTHAAKNNEIIRYGKLAKAIGIHHRPLRYVLGLIQDYCLANHLPPLTILVGNAYGMPGEGFIAWDVDNIQEGLKKVYDFNWDNLNNPFSFAKNGLTEEDIIKNLLNFPDNSKEMYSKIKVRGIAQKIFRHALLIAYDHKCAICDFSFDYILEASHIIPWPEASKNERLDVRNGLLLCPNHHKLFDYGCFTINDDYSINYYDPKEQDGPYSKYDTILSSAFHQRKLHLPYSKAHWPNIDYLRKHRKING